MSNFNIKSVKPNGRYKSGKFIPKNPEKYVGDINNIIYRSSWEGRFCQYCDINPNIIKWSSEPLEIRFWNPIDKKEHSYFPDYYIKVKKINGENEEWLIEIKPSIQYEKSKKPKLSGNITDKKLENYNKDLETWIINRAKFDAAMKFADFNGYKFGVIQENFLFK